MTRFSTFTSMALALSTLIACGTAQVSSTTIISTTGPDGKPVTVTKSQKANLPIGSSNRLENNTTVQITAPPATKDDKSTSQTLLLDKVRQAYYPDPSTLKVGTEWTYQEKTKGSADVHKVVERVLKLDKLNVHTEEQLTSETGEKLGQRQMAYQFVEKIELGTLDKEEKYTPLSSEEVVVPLGSYQADRFQWSKTVDGILETTTYWMVKKLGIVKSLKVVTNSKGETVQEITRELTSYTPVSADQ